LTISDAVARPAHTSLPSRDGDNVIDKRARMKTRELIAAGIRTVECNGRQIFLVLIPSATYRTSDNARGSCRQRNYTARHHRRKRGTVCVAGQPQRVNKTSSLNDELMSQTHSGAAKQ
jgi:hypothetical protein